MYKFENIVQTWLFMLFVVMIYIIKNALENELNRKKITIFSTV